MKVYRAEKLGFCFGVQDAINLARKTTLSMEPVYSLGPLIHNQQVIESLAHAGLTTVESPDEVPGGSVLIRAHGVGPETLNEVQRRKLNVIDATCHLVRRAQNAVKQLHEDGYRVVVIGDADHPEVKGIVGYAPDVTVIAEGDELDRLPRAKRLGIVAQTTLSQEHFARVVGRIIARPFGEIKVINTLCAEVFHRQEAAITLCDKVDVMFVLGGLHSANTKTLARLCREMGVPTFHLEDWGSFRPEFVRHCRVAGVTAGASTPDWVIDRFVNELEAFEPPV